MRTVALCCAIVVFLSAVFPSPVRARQEDSRVSFRLEGPGLPQVEGTTNSLQIRRTAHTFELSVPLATLNTGLAARDKRMREYLEIAKFPTAVLTIPAAAVQSRPAPGEKSSAHARGSLRLHGEKREVLAYYSVRKSGKRYLVRSSARIDLRDYGIAIPTWLGVAFKPEVKISAHLLLD